MKARVIISAIFAVSCAATSTQESPAAASHPLAKPTAVIVGCPEKDIAITHDTDSSWEADCTGRGRHFYCTREGNKTDCKEALPSGKLVPVKPAKH